MDVLVTGAGGFSGSHLVPALLARGHKVIAVIGRTRGRLEPALDGNPSLTVLAGDLSQPLRFPRRIDTVVHAAARSPGPGVNSADLVRDNSLATTRLINYAREAQAKTFIYLSSLSIYGEIAGPVVDEETPVVNPDEYGITKYVGETTLRETPLRSLSIRLPGVIGPRSVRNWLTSVMEGAKSGRAIAIYNPQHPFNNAIHISDLCEFIAGLVTAEAWTGHDAVTVGAAGMTKVRRAVEILVQALRSTSSIEVKPAQKSAFTISSERACRLYGYRPMDIEKMLVQFAAENKD
jgi:UDP-glucose 4-epimerase